MKELENLKYEDYTYVDDTRFEQVKVGQLFYDFDNDKFLKLVGLYKNGNSIRATFLDKNDYPKIKFVNPKTTLESEKLGEALQICLDTIEKEFIGNFVKPFMNKFKIVIEKKIAWDGEQAYIEISMLGKTPDGRPGAYYNYILPYFDKNKMYKKMEAGKQYNVKDILW